MNYTEHAEAIEKGMTRLDANTGAYEMAEAHGFYAANCVGPREECREEYNRIIAEAAALTAKNEVAKANVLLDYSKTMLELKWEDGFDNVVMTAGKNLALDTFLAGSAYTVVGPYMGLISLVSYVGPPVASDTLASKTNAWYEVSATTYYPTVAARLTVGWTAASGGSKVSTTTAFSIITNAGTVKGCFLVYGSGAVATLGSTAGTLYSAGLFTGGDKACSPGDTLNVTYTASL